MLDYDVLVPNSAVGTVVLPQIPAFSTNCRVLAACIENKSKLEGLKPLNCIAGIRPFFPIRAALFEEHFSVTRTHFHVFNKIFFGNGLQITKLINMRK